MEKGLSEVSRILASKGEFIFNIPSRYSQSIIGTKKKTLLSIMNMLNGGKRKPTGEMYENPMESSKIFDLIDRSDLKLDDLIELELEKEIEDCYYFLKIPAMTESVFPELNYGERMTLLDKAYESFNKDMKVSNKWRYFVCSKN